MIKICIIGSHGLGKSTSVLKCAHELKKLYHTKSIGVINENVKEVTRLTKELNNSNFQKLGILDYVKKELESEGLYDILVSDRTAFDILVYGLYFNVEIPTEYQELAMSNLNTFTKVIFLRPDNYEQAIIDDGFRFTNIEERNEIDREFERLLILWGGEYIELKTSQIDTYPFNKLL
jgi:hypothetical protein